MAHLRNRFALGAALVCGLAFGGLAPGGLALGGAAQAQTDQAVFDLTIRGLGAGSLSFTGTMANGTYEVTGRLKSGGVVGVLRKVSYDAQAQGAVAADRFVPVSYAEKADTGKRSSESVMTYAGGVPQVKTYNPPRPPRAEDIDPATQGGTLDPLTALYATLRDVDPGQECTVSVRMFDGRRASQLTLGRPEARGDRVVCRGEYRRVGGFSAQDMAEKTRFSFSLTYAPVDGRMRVIDVSMDSLYGKARLKRR